MQNRVRFSEVTKAYLCRYYEILDEMVQGMTQARLTESISGSFIVQMIPHHRAAIEMSRNLLQYTTCVPLQDIAANIISSQTKSIEALQRVDPQCALVQNQPQDVCLYQRKLQSILGTMFHEMREAPADNRLNADFIREMIPHHEGAVRMSENALRYPICPELVPILQAIIISQKAGICKMERLLKRM